MGVCNNLYAWVKHTPVTLIERFHHLRMQIDAVLTYGLIYCNYELLADLLQAEHLTKLEAARFAHNCWAMFW